MTTQMSHSPPSYEPSSAALSSPLQPLLQMWKLRLGEEPLLEEGQSDRGSVQSDSGSVHSPSYYSKEDHQPYTEPSWKYCLDHTTAQGVVQGIDSPLCTFKNSKPSLGALSRNTSNLRGREMVRSRLAHAIYGNGVSKYKILKTGLQE